MSGDINVQSFSGKVNISNNLLVGSSHLFVDTVNNRVGITTADPGASLEVNGNVHIETDLTLGGILTGDGSGLANVNSDSGLWAGAGTGSVYLSTLTDKVGIGTTSPGAKLEVHNSGAAAGIGDLVADFTGSWIRIGDARSSRTFSGGSGIKFHDTGVAHYSVGQLDGKFKISVSSSDGDSLFPSGYTEGITLNTSGNVGIGTTDPDGTLHVKADNRVHITTGTTPAFTGLFSTTSDNGRSQLVLSSAYSDLVIASSRVNNAHGSTLSFTTVNPSNTAEYRKFVINQGNWGSRKDFLDFGLSASTADANPHFSINSIDTVLTLDGNNKRVGIGTTSPGYKLDVNGDINSSGKINMGTYAVQNGYMASKTLSLGDIDSNYGGGNNWNANTAALMFECADNTEIAVHDSGSRVASLMYFEGASTNRITIGRDMGWGTIASVRMYGSQSYPNRPVAMVGKSNGRVYTPNVIVYNSVIYNDGGLYNTSNGRFTAPAGYAGYYLVTYTGLAGERELAPNTRWQLNGNDLAWGAAHVNMGSGVDMDTLNARIGMNTQFIYYLNAGDYLTHRVITGSIYGSASTHSTTVVMFMGSR